MSLVRRFLERMTQEHKLIDEVAVLVEHHLAPAQFARDGAGDALDKRRLGASLVQVYSGLIYQGPGLVGDIVRAW